MKFGKVKDLSTVDFSLPKDALSNEQLLSTFEQSAPIRFYIGCTGWSMKEWLGKVYPLKAKTTDFLAHYGKQFNTIELNTTHYRIPNIETIEKWKAATPSDFRFCPKLPQSVSHSRDLGLESGNLERFCNVIELLDERLGCCFMQLPPYFDIERLGMLERFLANFPSSIPLAVELRHESWFASEANLQQATDLLMHYSRTFVLTDVAGRRDVLHNRLTSRRAMIRFVGNALHPSDYERIDTWLAQLKIWIAKGLSEIYFFPHEPDNILAPEMAVYLHHQITKILPEVQSRGPKLIQLRTNEQMSLF